jgi:hypothetical protein
VLLGAVILLKIVKIASFTLLIKTGVITILGVCVLKETMKVMLHRMFIIITDNGLQPCLVGLNKRHNVLQIDEGKDLENEILT